MPCYIVVERFAFCIPQVTSVECEVPPDPGNGKAVYTSFAYNSVVSYECKAGYTIIGDKTRRCGADGKWSGQTPLCTEINCGSPGVLYNGWIDNIENGRSKLLNNLSALLRAPMLISLMASLFIQSLVRNTRLYCQCPRIFE